MMLLLALIAVCLAQTTPSPDVGRIQLFGACNVATEKVITASTTNSTAGAFCNVVNCVYDLTPNATDSLITCRLEWNFGGSGEVIREVHIHWRGFTYVNLTVPAGKVDFPLGSGALDSDNGFVSNTDRRISDVNFKYAIRYYAFSSSAARNGRDKALYANFHSQWSPPPPMGAIAGRLEVLTTSGQPVGGGSFVILPSIALIALLLLALL